MAIPLAGVAFLLATWGTWDLTSVAAVAAICAGGFGAGLAWLRGDRRFGSWFLCLVFLGSSLVAMLPYGGVKTVAGASVVTAVAIAGVLLGRVGVLVHGTIAIGGTLAMAWLGVRGMLPEPPPGRLLASAATLVVNIGVICLLGALGDRFMKARRQEAAQRIHTDDVTELPNRRGLQAALEELVAADATEAALALVEIDRFELLAAAHDAHTTQALLRSYARRLTDAVRPQDLVAHVGSGCFAVILRRAGPPTTLPRIGQRLKARLDAPLETALATVAIQSRVALTPITPRHTSANPLLRDAEATLASLRRRPARWIEVWDEGLDGWAQRTVQLDARLRDAIANDQLEPWYQPIVRLETGRPVGFEALARWVEPDGTVVSPAEFIPHAEETGLIVEIDRLVLRRAVTDLAACHERLGSDAWVSVNLSARQFESGGLVEAVADALRDGGLPASALHLELTESALTLDVASTRAQLEELAALGVVLVLDDFGTGWSSLSYIHSYPLHTVKIDRSFVRTIDDEGGHELAATVQFMAHSLGLDVVAEGIETRIQYQRLRELGVELGQGYHFSRPVPSQQACLVLLPWVPEEPSRPWDLDQLRAARDLLGPGDDETARPLQAVDHDV